jgi:hypothetical protein
MGRPTKCTPDRVKRLLDAIRRGATFGLACRYAGISTDSLARWRNRNAAFAAELDGAEAEAAIGWLTAIERAADRGDWRAAAWALERRCPEFGPNGSKLACWSDGPVEFTLEIVSPPGALAGPTDSGYQRTG